MTGPVGRRGNYRRKLTDDQVLEILARSRDGETDASIADDYPVSARTVMNIRTGRTHRWLTGVPDPVWGR